MPDELKIPISVPGAAQAKRDLDAVAEAERHVGEAAARTGDGAARNAEKTKSASEAARAFHVRNLSVLHSLRALGPEFAVAADVIGVFMNCTTAAGIGLGLLGAAITAVTLGIGALSSARAEEKRQAEAVLASLHEQREAYMRISLAADQARLAEERRGKRPGEAPPAAARIAAEAALAVEPGMAVAGAEGIQAAAEALAAGAITTEEVPVFEMWLDLGYGRPLTDPDRLRRRFLSWLRSGKQTPDSIRREHEAARGRFGQKYYAYREEAAAIVGGASPAGQTEEAFARVARQETAAGRPPPGQGAEQAEAIRSYLARLLSLIGYYTDRGPMFERALAEREAELAGFLSKYPELRQVHVVRPPTRPEGFILPPEFVKPGQTGFPLQQFLGGTHYHNNVKQDPAGVPVRAQAP